MPVAVEALKKCPLFAGFTDTGLGIIAEIAVPHDLSQGATLFLQGKGGDGLFIVESGEVEIFVGQGASTKVLCSLKAGAHFGELGLLRAGKRAASARAGVVCKIIEIRRADFNEILKTKPQACMKLMLNVFSSIQRRLDAVEDDLLHLA